MRANVPAVETLGPGARIAIGPGVAAGLGVASGAVGTTMIEAAKWMEITYHYNEQCGGGNSCQLARDTIDPPTGTRV